MRFLGIGSILDSDVIDKEEEENLNMCGYWFYSKYLIDLFKC